MPVHLSQLLPSRCWPRLAIASARSCGALLALTFIVNLLPPGVLPAQGKLHPEELQMRGAIDQAIDRGVEHLFDQQFRDGSWSMHGDYIGGRGGLCLYTLLQCGVARDHPSIKRAVAYLDSCEPDRTYATTCMILALHTLRDGREKRIEALVQKLVSWQLPNGMWSYPHGGSDLSCTQYAALGLWVGVKRGIAVDKRVFRDLLEGLEEHRTKVHMIANPLAEGRTGATKIASNGYSYRRSADANQKPTGSMTTAGIAVLEICKAGLGRRMSRSLRRATDERIEAAMTWMSTNFSVSRNPNGGHHHYYLYGLERIGALTNREQIGPHWWYVSGAKYLLGSQNKKTGAWSGVNGTCFSLLFLRRATSGHAPTTGGAGGVRHIFAVGDENSDIRLRGAGQQPLSIWIDGFGEGLVDLHSEFGIRIVSVEYLDDAGNVLANIAADPTKTWSNATFLHRDKAMRRGTHKVHARVTLLANDTAPGDTDAIEVIESQPMQVMIRDVIEGWMETANVGFQHNLLRQRKVEISASSLLDDRHPATHLIDGLDSKKWIASPDDKNPTVTMTWKKTITVASIIFAPCAQHDRELKNFDTFGALEVQIGNDRDRWLRIPVNPDKLAPTTFVLAKPRKMRAIKFRFLDRVHQNGNVGLSEFSLLPMNKKRKRR